MDVSKIQQKYNPCTCFCFSVMGQRRFRVSMGVLIAPPEAGDASVNNIPQMKKHTGISGDSSKSFISTTSKRNNTNQSAEISTSDHNSVNSINKNVYSDIVPMKNCVFDKMSSSTIYDNFQFPYYRSNKSDSNCPDAVLVKDVGVSCMLLNHNASDIAIPETKTLVKHLKKEYNDLSNITSKITTYTKDILSHLSNKNNRQQKLLKKLVASKHAIASQYVDSKGNLCLKLRLFSNAETQCTDQQAIKNSDSIRCKDKHATKKLYKNSSKRQIFDENQITKYDENIMSKYEKYVQTIIDQENVETNTSNSILSSTSSIYNHLTMKKKKTSSDLINHKLTKVVNIHKFRNSKRFNDDKDSKDYSNRKEPVIFTTWKEISSLKHPKQNILSITSNDSQQTAISSNRIFEEEFINYKTINNVPNTKFHTINLRFIKQNRKRI